jgi:hypothetical protein
MYQVEGFVSNDNEARLAVPCCPALLNVLKVFVSEAQSPRWLHLPNIKLCLDWWRAILFHCNKNVTLNYEIRDVGDFKLKLLIALEPTKSMQSLELEEGEVDFRALVLLCASVTKNHGLPKLVAEGFNIIVDPLLPFSNTQWEFVCSSLASHPTLTLQSNHRCPQTETNSLSIMCHVTTSFANLHHLHQVSFMSMIMSRSQSNLF